MKTYRSFADFYPFYLSQHQHPMCRRLHFIGSCAVLLSAMVILGARRWDLIWLLPVLGYGFAWAGHCFFEKNRPATFQYPLYSLMGDWVMFGEILFGRIRL